jgi:hypothetical protein
VSCGSRAGIVKPRQWERPGLRSAPTRPERAECLQFGRLVARRVPGEPQLHHPRDALAMRGASLHEDGAMKPLRFQTRRLGLRVGNWGRPLRRGLCWSWERRTSETLAPHCPARGTH